MTRLTRRKLLAGVGATAAGGLVVATQTDPPRKRCSGPCCKYISHWSWERDVEAGVINVDIRLTYDVPRVEYIYVLIEVLDNDGSIETRKKVSIWGKGGSRTETLEVGVQGSESSFGPGRVIISPEREFDKKCY